MHDSMSRRPGPAGLSRALIPCVAAAVALASAPAASAQVAVLATFDPPDAGGLCSVASADDGVELWVYDCSAGSIVAYDCDESLLLTVDIPGGGANDVDLDVADIAFSLAGTPVPAGTVLVINGESGVAEVYGVDPVTGEILATLVTEFGSSHVVGGGLHPTRGTLFLVQDRNGGAEANRVAEIDADTGAVLGSFSTLDAGFDVNFGDLDVDPATGNLLIVSSIESTIAEFSPAGRLLGERTLPEGVGGLSGISALGADRAWVASTGGTTWLLDQFSGQCPADLDDDGAVGLSDLLIVLSTWGPVGWCADDVDGSGQVGFDDLLLVLEAWGPCS